jgi:N-acetylmuramoyl-L-alanine amidase
MDHGLVDERFKKPGFVIWFAGMSFTNVFARFLVNSLSLPGEGLHREKEGIQMSRCILNPVVVVVSVLTLVAGVQAWAFRVFIDPGHGGDYPGAPTHISDYHEKMINLQVALVLKDSSGTEG